MNALARCTACGTEVPAGIPCPNCQPTQLTPDAMETLAVDTRPPLEAGHTIAGYRLLQHLGEGGMGDVWLVEQTLPLRRRAALKLIKPGMASKEVLARFESERQALALLDHPYVARVYEAGTIEGGRPYYLMEYVAGVPVNTHCESHGLDRRERLQLFMQVCQGAQHAHDHGIVHRDLKPSNIMVALRDGTATPKIIDFGIAKALAGPLTDKTMHTRVGMMMGTPEYMSPEQAAGSAQDVDGRTDVYSLGVILYELLTGKLPLDSDLLYRDGQQGMARIVKEVDPPAPSVHDKTLAGDLDRVILKAIHKERLRRYGSPMEIAADLERYLAGEPVKARPSTITYRTSKFLRRHQTRLLLGALAAALVILAAVTWRPRSSGLASKSIALFPLKSPDGIDSGYVSDALSEELLGLLSKGGWRVISTRATERVKSEGDLNAIRKQLNVGMVVEGTVRRAEERARVQLRIVETATGQLVWAQSFDRPVAEMLGMEREMASAVANELGINRVPLSARRQQAEAACAGPEARRAYLDGRRTLGKGNTASFVAAADIYERALKPAPRCAKLWAGLAGVRQAQADWTGEAPLYEEARKLARRAIELDEGLAEPHTVLGGVKMSNEWDWAGAEVEFRTATKLDPDNPDILFSLARMVKAQGRLEEAVELHQRVAKLDPLLTTNIRQRGMMLHYLGRHQEAMADFEKVLAMNPAEGGLHAMMSRTRLAMGDAQAALAEAEKEPRTSVVSDVFGSYTRAMALWAMGRQQESDAEVEHLAKKFAKIAPYNIAEVYAFRGDKERMFHWLNEAMAWRDTALGLELKCDPLFTPYRVDARFTAILQRMNLPQ